MNKTLTTVQLEWLRQNIRSFAPAERQVTQRDESAAESNAKARGCWPGEALHLVKGSRP